MLFIPGILIAIMTFPGVIVHEWAHKFFCDKFKVRVLEVCYFRFSNPCGYVIHEKAKTFKQTFFITVGPFILNSMAAFLIFMTLRFFISEESVAPFGMLLAWLGVSIGMHAFPSSGDANSLWEETNRHVKTNILAIVGYPISIFINIASFLSIFWFDLIYTFFLVLMAGLIMNSIVPL